MATDKDTNVPNKTDCIIRAAAIKACKSATDQYEPIYSDIAIECAVAKIRKLPAADVVEVVRCKDCKHYKSSLCWENGIFEPCDDDFCSKGERRTE